MCASGAKLQLSGSSCSFELHTRLLEARLRSAAPGGLGNICEPGFSGELCWSVPKELLCLKGRLGRHQQKLVDRLKKEDCSWSNLWLAFFFSSG